jgi:glycosyltransferase involved in cell wall biosynthesis
VKLRLAGSGPEEPALRRFLSENRMTNVQLLGFVAGKEREKLMQGASFFVLPSEWYENCPLVVLEAFAYGKPVIAARIGGIPELVKPGYNGLLFEPGNASELREKIRFLLSNPREALRMGENARKTAEKEYSPQVHYRNLMAIYEEVIAKQGRLAPNKKPSRSA